ncbi:hypothetical protein [Massilia sp. TSP1-1-2]|uniref:hypothetical protein n=1 Tax=Massilia sp. TSP1-1-2 TaxID=2804649 RepID=UPI003CF11025
MKTAFKRILAVAALVMAAPMATATVLNFDDLTGIGAMSSYGGFTFSDWNYYDFAQSPYNPASGQTRLFSLSNKNDFGSATAFTFEGASLAGDARVLVHFNMFRGGALVGSSGTLEVSDRPTFLSSGYAGLVDRVTVFSNKPEYFVMDDLTFNAAVAVPEPGSLALLVATMAAMAAMAAMGCVAGRRKASARAVPQQAILDDGLCSPRGPGQSSLRRLRAAASRATS